jgi:hypothetical protein
MFVNTKTRYIFLCRAKRVLPCTREQLHRDTSCRVTRIARRVFDLAAQLCTIFPRRDLVMPTGPQRSQRVRGNPHVCVTTGGIVGQVLWLGQPAIKGHVFRTKLTHSTSLGTDIACSALWERDRGVDETSAPAYPQRCIGFTAGTRTGKLGSWLCPSHPRNALGDQTDDNDVTERFPAAQWHVLDDDAPRDSSIVITDGGGRWEGWCAAHERRTGDWAASGRPDSRSCLWGSNCRFGP